MNEISFIEVRRASLMQTFCLEMPSLPYHPSVRSSVATVTSHITIRPVISALFHGWTRNERRRIPVFFAHRENLSFNLDDLLCLSDRLVVPLTLPLAVLHLLSGHLGVNKMKSLARLVSWWPELSTEIVRTTN